ncbi:MAG TPA: BF3164 family lipoprotein [Longimicrobium sp.]|jgi:hypothetical protein|uniref:BF3164 family lipoprotein n=1 Tax=Longimicrobium sp. TaxID=2029185 RepID=UPI002EDA6907
MRKLLWTAAALLVAGGAVAALGLSARPGGDVLLASSFRTYDDDDDTPRVQRLPEGRNPVPLSATRVLGDSVSFGFIDDIALMGPELLLLDRYGPKALLFMNLRSGQITRAAGRRGRGPGEYLWARSIDKVPDGPNAGTWIYDMQQGRFTVYDAAARDDRPRRIVRAPTGLYSPVWLGDTLTGNGMFPQEMLRKYVLENDVMKEVAKAGTTPFTRELRDIAMILNRTTVAVPPSRRGMVAAYRYTSRLDFYDRAGRRLHSATGLRSVVPTYRVVPDPRSRLNRWVPLRETSYAYLDVDATDRFVYALFAGRSHKDYRDSYDAGNRVEVFTWDGRLQHVWELGEDVSRIEVDPVTGNMYGAREVPFPAVVEFRLPGGGW